MCDKECKNKLKGICEPQWKIIKFGEFKKWLDGSDYQNNVIFI